jgi:hypothetical protein
VARVELIEGRGHNDGGGFGAQQWGQLRWPPVGSARSCSAVALRWRWGLDESTTKATDGGAHQGRGSAVACLRVPDDGRTTWATGGADR